MKVDNQFLQQLNDNVSDIPLKQSNAVKVDNQFLQQLKTVYPRYNLSIQML